MNVGGVSYRSIWAADGGRAAEIIDQTRLPFAFETARLNTLDDAAHAIRSMQVRGAPLIGVTAAWGMALAARDDARDAALERAAAALTATRPTAVNLRWAVDDMRARLMSLPAALRPEAAVRRAREIADEDVETCEAIGGHGVRLVREAWERAGRARPVNILTHCNAGWLAAVDWGTATAPVYKAHAAGVPVHVWVDETRPRNQGAGLTAWELGGHGIAHTVIADNAGGHLMQEGAVDLCITGADRATRAGGVANKIGTYLKALAAHDTGVPFYTALPGTTIDWTLSDGADIPIEERPPEEVTQITGRAADGRVETVTITPEGAPAANPAFDVTPARLVTGLITERGVARASPAGLAGLYPEKAGAG